MIGESLGHYRIDARLGSGGMGVVYRAYDKKLQRTVAIKVVGQGNVTPEERARLLDEARAASHLTHPNICTVYEVGEANGHSFIAMEFVAGRLLAEMVPPGGLPTETVVRLGSHIAAALAHAHERGVVHRDLKSANVAVNEQGAKVLDFGIARRLDAADPEGETRPMTPVESDVVLGTLAYAAPEVLLGRHGDARSDIWALGVVLFEIATGELPFGGRSKYELTAAILRTPARPFPAHVPPILRGIILRCLAKDPDQRYQRAGEVRAALEAVQTDVQAIPIAAPRRLSGRAAWIAGGLTLLAAVVLVWQLWPAKRGVWESAPEGQLTQIVSEARRAFDPALSADGRMLVYAGQGEDGRIDLFVRRVAGGARVNLTSDEAREELPRFSPDGEWVAFTRRDGKESVPQVRVLPALGGEARATIANASSPAWSPDGQRLAYIRRGKSPAATELVVSNLDGSNARLILAGDSVYPFLRSPAWSPDGRELAIVRGTGGVAGELWTVSVEGAAARRLLSEPASTFTDSPVYAHDGSGIVHSSNRGGATNIWFLPLRGGAPLRLTRGPGPDESPSVATDGSVAFVNSRWRNTLEIFDLPDGPSRTILTHSPFIWAPALSPDGREIAFSRSEVDGTWHIWSIAATGGEAKRITDTDSGEVYSRYSPDGATIWFHTWNAPRRIGRVARNGGPPVLQSFGVDDAEAFPDVSPDGRLVAFTASEAETERIYIAPVGGGAARLLTPSPGTIPRWSPDGARIAFSPTRGYGGGVFVINADGTGERRLTAEGGWPVWWPDGRTLGYIALGAGGDQEIRLIDADGAPLRTLPLKFAGTNHPFGVFPNGRRLAISNAVHISDEIWLLRPRAR